MSEQQHKSQKQTKIITKNLISKLSRTVNSIAEEAFQLEEKEKMGNVYAKDMLCTARTQPVVEPFRKRNSNEGNLIKRASKEKVVKRVRMVEDLIHEKQPNQEQVFSKTVGANFYNQANTEEQMFLTMRGSFNFTTENISQSKLFSKTTPNFNNPTLRTDRKWTLEEFLKNLYIEKTKDLKTRPNPKQQQMFLERFKAKFQGYTQSSQNNYSGKQHKTYVVKSLNIPSSDFGPQSMRCISQFLLSNKLTSISSSQFYSYSPIKQLTLDRNPLGDEGVTILSLAIGDFPMLQKLSMKSVNMSPRGARPLLKSLIGHQHLTHVDFSSQQGLNRNRLGQSLKQMQPILSHPSFCLEYLNLTSTNIGENGLSLISNGVHKQCTIKELLVGENDIKAGEMAFFLEKFRVVGLEVLDLRGNLIGDDGCRMLVDVLGSSSSSNTLSRNLKHLNLSNNNLTSFCIEHYCKHMSTNQTLTSLQLSHNSLSRGEQFYHLKYFLSKNWTLKRLGLEACQIAEEDLRHLFEGLEENRALEELRISKNKFDLEAFVAMGKMLGVNKSLKVIECQSCDIVDKFIEKAHKDLRQSKAIQSINLSNNYLTDKSSKYLLQLLGSCKSLTRLTLAKNCLTIKSQTQLSSLLKSNLNRKQHNIKDQKQMQYLKYVAEIQQSHEENIRITIEKLQQKQEKVRLGVLVGQVVRVELEEEDKRRELAEEMHRLKLLQEKLGRKDKV